MEKKGLNSDSTLRSIAYKLMSLQTSNIDIIQEFFVLYRKGEDFDIYHLMEKFLPGYPQGTIELAVLRAMPKPHAHHNLGVSWFYFLDNNGYLDLGGAATDNSAVLSRIKVRANEFYPIPPYVYHAAGPEKENTTNLLIINPVGLRARPANDNYPADTYEKEKSKIWKEV